MISYTFHAQGHRNILSSHKTTLEFTKDPEVSVRGDCIVGVRADFSLDEIKKLMKQAIEKNNTKIKVIINVNESSDEFEVEMNDQFSSDHEIVFRKTGFVSERTLGIRATKAAAELNEKIKRRLSHPHTPISVIMEIG